MSLANPSLSATSKQWGDAVTSGIYYDLKKLLENDQCLDTNIADAIEKSNRVINCINSCGLGCASTCNVSCGGSCIETCQSVCDNGCTSTCEKVCKYDCDTGCAGGCDRGCAGAP